MGADAAFQDVLRVPCASADVLLPRAVRSDMRSDSVPQPSTAIVDASEELLERTRAGASLMAAAHQVYTEYRHALPHGVGVDELIARSRSLARR